MYYIYILRCVDESLYTGISNDVQRRYQQHLNKKGAKYTRSHPPKKIEIVFECENKHLAASLEYKIKHLTKLQKEDLIQDYQKYIDTKIYKIYTFR